MKTIQYIYTIIMVMCTMNMSAQTKSIDDIKGMQKELAEVLNGMVESAKPYYKEGDTYMVFKQKLYGVTEIAPISKEGEQLIEKVYYYLKTKATSSIILNDSGEVIADAITYTNSAKKLNKNANLDRELFGVSANTVASKYKNNHPCGCCFFCFRCQVQCARNIFGF
ncbi:hypothetical protein [Lacinutrix sp. MEBiC02595]